MNEIFYKFFNECITTFPICWMGKHITKMMKCGGMYDLLNKYKYSNEPTITIEMINNIAEKYNISSINILPFSILQIITKNEECYMFSVSTKGKLFELSVKQLSELMRKLDYTRYFIEMNIDKKEELNFNINEIIKFISNRKDKKQQYFTNYSMSISCWESILEFNNILNKIKEKYKNVEWSTLNDRNYEVTIITRYLIRKVEISYYENLIQVDVNVERRRK